MKRIFFLMLMLIVLSTASMNAQVRIGDSSNPTAGAVLDLNNPDGYKGGLLLPKVELTTLSDPTDIAGATDENKADLKGLIVYNTSSSPVEGIYVWTGSEWFVIWKK
jgi:exosome complex RNA-binding protein Rrp42 (RNase PH superfamily)